MSPKYNLSFWNRNIKFEKKKYKIREKKYKGLERFIKRQRKSLLKIIAHNPLWSVLNC